MSASIGFPFFNKKIISNATSANILIYENQINEFKIILRSAIETVILITYLSHFPNKINDYLDEELIKLKYNYFINHYRQEKGFVKDYEKWYTIAGDETSIVYHFNRNKIAYGYVIFYKYKDLGAINNDWGIEMFIEPELIENFINTKKIIVKDNNDKEIKTIENKKTITKITSLMSRTIPALNNNQNYKAE